MSRFSQKVFKGELPTSQDWSEHLIEAHTHAPSMTPNAFAAYLSKNGQNSYQILANEVKSNGDVQILDLGCGDGYLTKYLLPKLSAQSGIVGLDMSEAELNIAREHIKDDRVSLVLGNANQLPLQASSIDHVLCHMVFMLMTPIEPIISEIKRVLKSAGMFSAVIGNSKNVSPNIWHDILNSVYGPILTRYPKLKEAAVGDHRVNSEEGLKTLFNSSTGFSSPNIHDFSIVVEMTPDNAWSVMKDMYFVGMLPAEEKSQTEKDLRKFVSTLSTSHKAFEFPMRLFSVTKL